MSSSDTPILPSGTTAAQSISSGRSTVSDSGTAAVFPSVIAPTPTTGSGIPAASLYFGSTPLSAIPPSTYFPLSYGLSSFTGGSHLQNIPQPPPSSLFGTFRPETAFPSVFRSPVANTPFQGHLTQACAVKLTRDNYLLWKSVVLPIVRGHRLEGYLLGTIPRPSTTRKW